MSGQVEDSWRTTRLNPRFQRIALEQRGNPQHVGYGLAFPACARQAGKDQSGPLEVSRQPFRLPGAGSRIIESVGREIEVRIGNDQRRA